MAETFSPRFGIRIWGAGTDTPSRDEFNANFAALESKAAMFVVGLASARPAFGVAGRFYFSTDTQELWYDAATAWQLFGYVGRGLASARPAATGSGRFYYSIDPGAQGLAYDIGTGLWAPIWSWDDVFVPSASRIRSASQMIPDASVTEVLFNTNAGLTEITYDGSSGHFTVHTAGWYLITAAVTWDPDPGGRRQAGIYVNGAAKSFVSMPATALAANNACIQVAWQGGMNLNDQFSVRCYHSGSGGNTHIGTDTAGVGTQVQARKLG